MDDSGYSGPAVWIRIQHRFSPRKTEWIWAVFMAGWGVSLLLPTQTFAQDSFAFFRQIFTENFLGWSMVLVGMARIVGLFVNGARKHVTPWIRVTSAGIGFIVFGGINYCFLSSGVISTWVAIYPLLMLVEILNIYSAARDAGENYAVAGNQ